MFRVAIFTLTLVGFSGYYWGWVGVFSLASLGFLGLVL